ncbi:MAG: cytochrome c biogenesis protein CcsA [Myxococcales bacterium]|nr:cytochrome c biogenesis protein CcsA [Myxococcales bacterium]
MIDLFREMIAGFFSGRADAGSASLFDLSFVAFIVTTVCYLIYLGGRRDGVWKTGRLFGLVAAIALTAALILRWIAAGWAHPPFTNMYESLVFFVWGIVVVYLFVEFRYQVRIAGAFVMPLAGIAMGIASLSPNKEIEPLVPALQSVWLHLHVAVASIGYAAFLTAFVFSVLFLLKDKVRMNWFIVVAAGFVVFAVLGASKGAVIGGAAFPMDKTVMMNDTWIKEPLPGGAEGQFSQVVVPGAGPLLLAALILAVLTVIAAVPSKQRADLILPTRALLATFVLLTAGLVWLFVKAHGMPDTRLAANPYALALLVLGWLGCLLVLIFQWRNAELMAALPSAETLDRLGYKSVMVGFPLMTLVIVTGAIWANKAWGRPWGWDPKETASLVTWIIYLLYLHTRLTAGWTGRRSNLIAIVGFLSVIFTYLGVNLLLSGLHAYATG